MGKAAKLGIAAGLSAFLALSVAFCIFLYSSTKTLVRGQAIRNLTNICELNEDAITRAFQSRENIMKMLSSRLTRRGTFDVDAILHDLKDFEDNYDCYYIGVLDETKTLYRTDGVVVDMSDMSLRDLIWDEQSHISRSYFPSDNDESMVNMFSCPVFENGKLKCVLVATYYSRDLAERMNINSLRGKGFTFLLNEESEIVIYPQDYKNQEYIDLMDYIHDSVDIAFNENEDLFFEFKGERYYAHYENTGVNDWYLMTCAREEDVFAEASLITRRSFEALGVMWIFIAVSVGVTLYSMHRFQERLRTNYFYDHLLGIGNQNALEVYFKKLPAEVLENSYLVVSSVDRFKEFNYIYGDECSDRLLQYIARVIQEETPQAMLFRYKSDYFVIHDPSMREEELGQNLNKVKERFAADIDAGEIQPFSLSGGMRQIEMDVPLQQLISDALIAKDTIAGNHLESGAFYDESLRRKQMQYMEMESRFSKALRNKEFHVYYQPKYDMATGEIIGAEALVRWIQKDGSIISPGAFIPCFEASRQITLLDEFMLSEVCRQMKEMLDEGLQIKPVSVNLSRVHLQQPDMMPKLVAIIEKSGIDPHKLSFEITESALLEEAIPLITIVEQLRAMGCRVDMDDYGVGASGPRALASNCFDVVKLDKSFTDDIGNGQVEAVIEATIRLAKRLGLKVLAEGVEEKYQVERLMELGCYYAQGYYYSKPVPEEEYRSLLKAAAHTAAAGAEESELPVKKTNVYRSYRNSFSEDFCLALDTTEIPIYIIDPATFEIIYCNESMRQYMGKNPLGEVCHCAFRGLNEPCPDCAVVKILKEGVHEAVEYHRPSGRWMLVNASPLHWRGREYFKVTCTDVTKLKQ